MARPRRRQQFRGGKEERALLDQMVTQPLLRMYLRGQPVRKEARKRIALIVLPEAGLKTAE